MNLTLSKKIPLAITLASVITGGAITYMSISSMSQGMQDASEKTLSYSVAGRVDAVDRLMKLIVADLHTIADSPWTLEALKEYNAAWNELGGNQTAYLHKAYITDNPNELGKKNALEAADDGSSYSKIHAKNHPYLNEFLTEHGYYDVFLVNKNGDVVYSVFKENDFATNLLTGEWKDTDLGNVFRAIMAQKDAEDVSFVDFAPYAPSNNVPASFMGRPIEDGEGNYLGALIYQMPIQKLNDLFTKSGDKSETGRIMLVGSDKLVRNDVRFAKESTILKMKVDNEAVEAALAGKSGIIEHLHNENSVPVYIAYAPYEFGGAKFALISEINDEEIEAPVVEARNEQLMIGGAIVAIISIIGIFFAGSITKAISGITRAMKKVADGELSTEVPHLSRKDEIGNMATALQVFKENAQAMEQMQAQEIVQKKAMEEQKKGAMRQIADSFEASVKGVVDMVASAATEMDATSRSVSDVVDSNKGKLTALTNQIAGTSRNVQMVSSATTQLSSAINEISSQVARATTITTAAVEEALKADTTTKGLVDASQKIGEVLEMINSIAAQINLLALNATIEAARAGEAGKGFAVVASEVKNLAAQTTKATEQISTYITSIQGATKDTVGAIDSISSKIRDINSIATTIAAAVEEQGVATRDIATNVQQAANSTEEVSVNANDVSASSEQTGNAAHEMTAATSELSRQAEILRSEVDKFLVGIRA